MTTSVTILPNPKYPRLQQAYISTPHGCVDVTLHPSVSPLDSLGITLDTMLDLINIVQNRAQILSEARNYLKEQNPQRCTGEAANDGEGSTPD
jgi:hypothetical protein